MLIREDSYQKAIIKRLNQQREKSQGLEIKMKRKKPPKIIRISGFKYMKAMFNFAQRK